MCPSVVFKLFFRCCSEKKNPENCVVIFLKMSFKCFAYMMLELHTGGSSHQIGAGSADQRNKGLQLNIDSVWIYISLICVRVYDLQLYRPCSSSGAGWGGQWSRGCSTADHRGVPPHTLDTPRGRQRTQKSWVCSSQHCWVI